MSGFRISSLWAWTTVDPADDDEGIIGIQTPAGWLPLIASDQVRLDQYRGYAEATAKASGQDVTLRRFEFSEELDRIPGGGNGSPMA